LLPAIAQAVVVDLRRPSLPPARDGATRPTALGALDDHHRLSLRQVLPTLGWDSTTDLVATFEDGHGVIRAGRCDRPTVTRVKAPDNLARLTLPPFLTGALDVRTGDQVLAVAALATGELHVHAAADVAQALTGPVTSQQELSPPATLPSPATGRGRVRPRFGHAPLSV